MTPPASLRDRMQEHVLLVQGALDSEREGVFAFDAELRVLAWTAGMERATGLAVGVVAGRAVTELLPFVPADALARALGGEAVPVARAEHAFDERAASDFEARLSSARAAEGAAAIGVLREVTAERRAERLSREAERRFRTMADAAPVLLWVCDAAGACTFVNQTWLAFTGRTLEEERGDGFRDAVHVEDRARVVAAFAGAARERHAYELEMRLRRWDGTYRWVLDRGAPRYGPEGTFAGYVGSCTDVSELKRAEAVLQKAVADRDEFLAIAAHELRTPLTALQLQSDLLVRGVRAGDDREKVERSIAAAHGQVLRISRLVEELLDVSRLAAGGLELARAEIDLAAIATDAVARLGPVASAAGCALTLEVPAPGHVTGVWDRARLERVIAGLLTNAFKYGAGHPVGVVVGETELGGFVEVADGGIGIAKEDQERVFQRFERAVSSKNYGGFGLGLWIARRIVEAHGGTLEVRSAPGHGATFRIELPAAGAPPSRR